MNPFEISQVETEFLLESNLIEGETSARALADAKDAWRYARSIGVMKLVDVRSAHRLLMRRLWPQIAGEVRDMQVMVNGREAMDARDVKYELMQWCDELRFSSRTMTMEEKSDHARDMHVRFELIHPFQDGNGRVGRILYNWHRVGMGLPVHVIRHGTEQLEYHKWFE